MATISAYGSKNHKHKFSLIVTETSYSIENNTSQIEFDFRLSEDSGYYFDWNSWGSAISYTVTIDGTNYTGSIPEYTPSVSGTSLKRMTGITIPHQTDGTKTINISFNVKDNTGASYTCGNASKSGTLTLTNIPRGSVLGDIDNFDLLDSQGKPTIISLNIIKYIDTFYDELNIKIDNTLIKTYNNIKNNDSITFTTEELNQIYNLSKNSNNVPLSFILTTYADSSKETQIGNSSIKTPFGIITNANPIFTDFNYQDINPITSALSNDVILGYFTLKVSIPTNKKAIAQKGASMVSYSVEDVSLPYSSTQEVYTDPGLPNYNKNTLTVTAYDTRQNSTPVVKNLNVVNYVKLTADETQKSYQRQNNVGTQTKITFGGTWWNDNFGLKDNALTVSYKYKIAGSSIWTDGGNITPTISGNNYSFDNYVRGDAPDNGFLVKNSYDLVVRVEDKLDYVEFVYQIIAGVPAMKIKGNKVLEINGEEPIFGGEGDTLPIGAIVEYDGVSVPEGYEEYSGGKSIAKMNTSSSPSFASGKFGYIPFNQETFNIGNLICDTSNNRIKIPSGTTELIKITGGLAGSGGCNGYYEIVDDNGNRPPTFNRQRDGMIFQAGGNGYYNVPTKTVIMKIDKTKNWYVKYYVAGYNGTYSCNNGFSNTTTFIQVETI